MGYFSGDMRVNLGDMILSDDDSILNQCETGIFLGVKAVSHSKRSSFDCLA